MESIEDIPKPKRPINLPNTDEISVEEHKAIEFRKLHENAYLLTKKAIELDEANECEQAFVAYEKALIGIDKGVDYAHTGGFPEDKVNKIDVETNRMRATRKNILERISEIQHKRTDSNFYLDGPSSELRQSITISNMYTSLEDIVADEGSTRNPLPLNAREIFTIPENVQIFYISKDDLVSAPTYPSFLRIVLINQEAGNNQPPAFIQVGDWTYPLIPGKSPIYKAPDGAYMFPDLTNEGSTIGLILPVDLSIQQKEAFEDLIQQLSIRFPAVVVPTSATEDITPEVPVIAPTRSRSDSVPTTVTLGTKIAQGAEKLSEGIVYGAEKTSQALDVAGNYLKTKIKPVEENPSISPALSTGMKTARNITGKTVKISAYLVNQLGKGTVKLGQSVAPYLHKTATQLYAKGMSKSESEALGTVDQAFEVAAGAVVGFGTVFLGLEHAGKVLAKSIRNNSVTLVEHRYGNEAGVLCDDTTSTLGNTLLTGYNVKGLAPKALARRAAKDAGKALLTHQKESPPEDTGSKGGPPSSN